MKDLITNSEFITLFKETFKGRTDVVPKYWKFTDKETGEERVGYSPICANRYQTNICIKCNDNKAQCRNCSNQVYSTLTDDLLTDHFNGRHILGVYPLLLDNTCWFIAADFDNHKGDHDPLADVYKYYECCICQDISLYILRSKSGKGYHAYMFFNNPVPAWKARVVAFALLGEAGLLTEEDKIESFDRLFPNQNELSGKLLGNLIGLPFQGVAMKNEHTMFLDLETGFTYAFKDQINILMNIARVSEAELDEIIGRWDLKKEVPKSMSGAGHNVYATSKNEQFQKLLECDFIKYMYENQDKQTEPQWFSMISNVSRISPGGVELCHACSSGYNKYSRQETEQKILNVINGSPPHTCEYIKKGVFSCGKDCGVTSPIVLTHKKELIKKALQDNSKEIIPKIIEFSKATPDKILLEITKNVEYINAMAEVANSDTILWENTKAQLKENRVKIKDISTIETIVREKQKEIKNIRVVENDEILEYKTVKQVLSDAPVKDNIVIPEGWELSYENGLERIIWKEDSFGNKSQDRIAVSSAPILITARLINNLTGKENVRITWIRDGKWKSLMTKREVIAKSNDIVILAGDGLPVTSNTAKNLVEYLDNFESINKKNIPNVNFGIL